MLTPYLAASCTLGHSAKAVDRVSTVWSEIDNSQTTSERTRFGGTSGDLIG